MRIEMVTEMPDIPAEWMRTMGKAGRLSDTGFPVRLHEVDEGAIDTLAARYGVSKANIIRVLIHNALVSFKAV